MTTRPGQQPSTRPLDAPESLVGRVLDGRYRLVEVINVGGMGIIFRAHQTAADRTVAVKVLRPSLARDIDLARRFQQEIETLSKLVHPNIVTLHDCGQDAAGLHYLVMEYVQGSTLRTMLRATELTLPEILEVFAQTCDALVEAHACGVIHRDLKFDNVMVRRLEDGRLHVTILDFGVAKLLTRNESITRTGEVPGTPGIIAPELVDNMTPSPQSDLYSLGILMFTTLSGAAPFEADNEFELMRAHQNEELPRLEELIADRVPQPVIELVYELAQKEPKLRPGSASSVRDRLERLAERIRKRLHDVPRYVPPRDEAIKPIDDEEEHQLADRSMEFLAAQGDEEASPEGEPIADPLLVPSSVVGLLIAILIFLVLILLYLIYQTQVLQAS